MNMQYVQKNIFLKCQELEENFRHPTTQEFRQRDAPGQIYSSASWFLFPPQRDTHKSAARLQGLTQIRLTEYVFRLTDSLTAFFVVVFWTFFLANHF